MIGILLSGLALGLTFCAMPGAVSAESLRIVLRGGFRSVLGLQLGSLIGDALYGALSMLGLAAFLHGHIIQGLLGLVGIVVLLRSAWDGFKQVRAGVPVESEKTAVAAFAPDVAAADQASTPEAFGRTFWRGSLISLGNPGAVVFWLSIGSTMVASAAHVTGRGVALFYAGYMAGCIGWAFGFSALVAGFRRLTGPTFFRWIAGAASVALLVFAVTLARDTYRLLIP